MEINNILAEQSKRSSQGTHLHIASRPPAPQAPPHTHQAPQRAGPPSEVKQSRARKKEQAILQPTIPPFRGREHQLSRYTPPGHSVAPAPRSSPQYANTPPTLSYPTNTEPGERRLSGMLAQISNGDYRHQLAPAPPNMRRSPPEGIARRDSAGYDYLAGMLVGIFIKCFT